MEVLVPAWAVIICDTPGHLDTCRCYTTFLRLWNLQVLMMVHGRWGYLWWQPVRSQALRPDNITEWQLRSWEPLLEANFRATLFCLQIRLQILFLETVSRGGGTRQPSAMQGYIWSSWVEQGPQPAGHIDGTGCAAARRKLGKLLVWILL